MLNYIYELTLNWCWSCSYFSEEIIV